MKVFNMEGEDITPLPLTIKEEMMEDIIIHLTKQLPINELMDYLFNKYVITKK